MDDRLSAAGTLRLVDCGRRRGRWSAAGTTWKPRQAFSTRPVRMACMPWQAFVAGRVEGGQGDRRRLSNWFRRASAG